MEQGQPLCPAGMLLLARRSSLGCYSDILPFWHRIYLHFPRSPGAQKQTAPGSHGSGISASDRRDLAGSVPSWREQVLQGALWS